jgi:hypothetical protein
VPINNSTVGLLRAMICPTCNKVLRCDAYGKVTSVHAKCAASKDKVSSKKQRKEFVRIKLLLEDRAHHAALEKDVGEEDLGLDSRTWVKLVCDIMKQYVIASELDNKPEMGRLAYTLVMLPRHTPKKRNSSGQTRKQEVFEDSCIRKANKVLLTSGRPGKAMNKLRASKPFAITPVTEHAVRRLIHPRLLELIHPKDVFENPEFQYAPDADFVKQVIDKSDSDTGRSHSNWGYGDLKVLAKEDGFVQNLAVLMHDYVNGRHPSQGQFSVAMRSRKGIALEKKTPGEARGVGICEVLANLFAKTHQRQLGSVIAAQFGPHDTGIAVSDGPLDNAIALQCMVNRALKSGEDVGICNYDVELAYDTTPRAEILKILLARPELHCFVRHFLVSHAPSSTITYEGMESLEVEEGVTTGFALSPFFATLVYSAANQEVRDKHPGALIVGFIDDASSGVHGKEVWIVFDSMVAAYKKRLLKMHPKKQKMYFPNGASEYHKREAARRGVEIVEGLDVLGTPVGNKEYIMSALKAKAETARVLLTRLEECDSMGKLNGGWATTQGLFHVERDCVIHLLRHLIRGVDPELTMEAFKGFDEHAVQVAARILDIPEQELDVPCVRARFGLPGRMQGLGLLSLAGCAQMAYVGAVSKLGHRLLLKMPGLDPSDVSGLEHAVEELTRELHVLGMPSVVPMLSEVLTPLDGQAGERGSKKETLARRLGERAHKIARDEAERNATGLYKFAIQVATTPTSADFLYARPSYEANRTYRFFAPFARKYLGVAVTDSVCNMGNCHGVKMTPNGSHTGHVRGMLIDRHDEMKLELMNALKSLDTSRCCKYRFGLETHMRDLGFTVRRGFEEPKQGLICDFYLRSRDDHKTIITDVVISHPDMAKKEDWKPSHATETAAQLKHDKYCVWTVNRKDVIPLSFDTYGGYAKETWKFLHAFMLSVANNDQKMAAKLMRRLRERIATTLVYEHGRVIEEWNRRNSLASGRWKRRV